MKKLVIFTVCLFLISLISGQIVITNNFNSEYGVGDRVKLDFSIDTEESLSDYILTYLDCGAKKEIVDKRYFFSDGSKKSFSFEFPFPLEGECRFKIEFGEYKSESERFEIRNSVEIKYIFNETFFAPKETLKISGSVKKFNGENYNGNLEVLIEGISNFISVENGAFSGVIKIPNNLIQAGRYPVKLIILEKDENGNKILDGSATGYITLRSVESDIEIIGPSEISPPDSASYNIKLLDQSGKIIENKTLIFDLIDSLDRKISSGSAKSGENISLNFEGDFSKGNAYLSANYINLDKSYRIYINESQILNISYLDGKIIFRNIGNSHYWKEINFSLSQNDSFFVEKILINLSAGESLNWSSLDYEGFYDIYLEENMLLENKNLSFSGNSITGDIFKVNMELKENSYLIGFIILFILLAITGFFYRKKIILFFSKFRTNISQMKNKSLFGAFMKKGQYEFLVLVFNSSKGLSDYESKIKEKGLNFKKINENKGYALVTNNKGIKFKLDLFNFCKNLRKQAIHNSEEFSILINNYFSKKDIGKIKEFVLENLKLIDNFPGKFVLGEKVFPAKKLKNSINKEKVQIGGKEINVFVK